MNNETLDAMKLNFLEALDNDEILNQKGTSAIVKLVKGDDARAVIRHAIKSTGGDRVQYADGLKGIISLYSSSASISVRNLCELAATDKTSRRFLEERIIPLLVELGAIVKTGEKSYHWQVWDKIGTKPGLLDALKSSIAPTPEKLAAIAESEKAYAEKCKLDTALKAEAFAQRRKESLMRTLNANKQADDLAATLPSAPVTLADKAKTNPMAAALIVFITVGVITSMLTSESKPEPQLLINAAGMPSLHNELNGSPMLDPRIIEMMEAGE